MKLLPLLVCVAFAACKNSTSSAAFSNEVAISGPKTGSINTVYDFTARPNFSDTAAALLFVWTFEDATISKYRRSDVQHSFQSIGAHFFSVELRDSSTNITLCTANDTFTAVP